MSDVWITKDGEHIPWSELTDRHLLNIVRLLTRLMRAYRREMALPWDELNKVILSCVPEARRSRRFVRTLTDNEPDAARWRQAWRHAIRREVRTLTKKVARAFAEVEARGLMPTQADLHVAWDRVCGGAGGEDLSEDPAKRPWCLVELWVGFRGESTLSDEYAAKLREAASGSEAR